MIWIDMEKPKSCWWLDPDNNLIAHKCPFLDREHECILQARINLTCEKRYENCPLHEVTADTDIISRKQAVEVAMQYCPDDDGSCSKADSDIRNLLDDLENIPPSPSRPKGHWIQISPAGIYECSECGKNVKTNDIEAYEFCHGCGADMRQQEQIASLEAPCRACDVDDVKDMIEDAPTVTPEPPWIPVSERLPEDGERVLATHLGKLNPDRQVIEHIYANGEFTMGWDMDMNIDSPTFG